MWIASNFVWWLIRLITHLWGFRHVHCKFRKSIKSVSSIDKNDGACNGLVTSVILLVIGLCSARSRHNLTKRLITLWLTSAKFCFTQCSVFCRPLCATPLCANKRFSWSWLLERTTLLSQVMIWLFEFTVHFFLLMVCTSDFLTDLLDFIWILLVFSDEICCCSLIEIVVYEWSNLRFTRLLLFFKGPLTYFLGCVAKDVMVKEFERIWHYFGQFPTFVRQWPQIWRHHTTPMVT